VRQRRLGKRLFVSAAVAVLVACAAACREKPPVEPLQLDGNLLTVNNHSAQEWKNVEIWLNRNHSVRVPSIAAGSRLQVPLDSFVAGFGQRFNYKRTPITDLRLKATLPDGSPIELTHQFEERGLAGAFGGKR
jgi:hypothetical protein